MKVLVMGPGGVGGYYGGVLCKDGHDVTLVARGEHLEAISRDGLRVESLNSGNFTVRPSVTDRPRESDTPDLVLFCVKGYDNETAIELIRPAVGPDTAVLTLQNGIGSGDQLGAALGANRILLGATYIDGNKKGPGLITETGKSPLVVFGEQDGRITARAERVRDALAGAGVPVELSGNVEKALWEKLVYICGWSGMICVTRTFFPEIFETPQAEAMTRTVMGEVLAVAQAKQIDLDIDVVGTTLDEFRDVGDDPVSSMFTDLRREGRLEIEVLNGAVSRMGIETGVPTPANDFITACLLVPHNRALAQLAAN